MPPNRGVGITPERGWVGFVCKIGAPNPCPGSAPAGRHGKLKYSNVHYAKKKKLTPESTIFSGA
jgi:hypothetical protein